MTTKHRLPQRTLWDEPMVADAAPEPAPVVDPLAFTERDAQCVRVMQREARKHHAFRMSQLEADIRRAERLAAHELDGLFTTEDEVPR